jgi:outer membrane protein assembly factor BamB
MSTTRLLRLCCALTILLAGAAGIGKADPGCAGPSSGGDWPQYGHDTFNTRSQPLEDTIDATKAASLAPSWYVQASSAGLTGSFQSTPAVADGCVFVSTTDGWVAALNADKGDLKWKTNLGIVHAGFAGKVIASPAVDGGRVFVIGNENGDPNAGVGPFVAALNEDTGAIDWQTTIDTQQDGYSNASPVVFNGMIFAGIAGNEASPRARGGYALLDEKTGAIVTKRFVINDDDYAKGYAGASVWSTAAVDAEHGYAYVGGGNPASKKMEHPFSNALLKIDVDPARATFGKVVAAFKGNADAYSATLGNQPACDLLGDNPALQYYQSGVWSLPCAQLDLDFGASPNLFKTATGRLLVGDLQKSGVYHAADATVMTDVFDLPVGAPCFACNAASPSTSGDKIFVASVPPGQVTSLDGSQGLYRWAYPLGDGLHYQPVSNANGVVYVVDGGGNLNIVDASNGVLIQRRGMSADAGGASASALTSSAGIAIARHTVYAATAGIIVAYK